MGVGTKPERLRFRTDAGAGFGDEEGFQVAEEVGGVGGGGFVLDVVGGVVVHPVEIVAAFDEGSFFGGEGWEAGAELLDLGRVSGVESGVGIRGEG